MSEGDAIGEGGALLGGRAAEVAGRMTVGRLVICSRRQVWFRVFLFLCHVNDTRVSVKTKN